MQDIKSTYRTSLWLFTGINTLVFWFVIVEGNDVSTVRNLAQDISWTDGLVGLIAPIVTLALSGIMSALAKARLVYWRFKYPLPGSYAFSRYMHADPRINVSELRAAVDGDLPTDPTDQNRLWYRFMKEVESDTAVQQSNRSWLFSRDLTAYSFIFVIVFGLSSIFLSEYSIYYVAILIGQYLVFAIAARNYGVRFVTNVLTARSHE